MVLKERFLQLFKAADISYAELAKASDVSQATISRAVNGGSVGSDILEKLVKTLEAVIPEDALAEMFNAGSPPPTHCDRCRADQNAHNRILREDFNLRHTEMERSYESRIAEQAKSYEARIAAIEASHARELSVAENFYAQRHEMHEAQKKDLRSRNRVLTIACIVLGAVISAALIIDLLHGGVGWFRYSVWEDTRNELRDVVRYIAHFFL